MICVLWTIFIPLASLFKWLPWQRIKERIYARRHYVSIMRFFAILLLKRIIVTTDRSRIQLTPPIPPPPPPPKKKKFSFFSRRQSEHVKTNQPFIRTSSAILSISFSGISFSNGKKFEFSGIFFGYVYVLLRPFPYKQSWSFSQDSISIKLYLPLP